MRTRVNIQSLMFMNTDKLYFASLLFAVLPISGCNGSDSNDPQPVSGAPAVEVEVGKQMPLWQSGTLEMHSISTGRGECNFYIMPDGTTMLVDFAGSLVTPEICKRKGVGGVTPARPNSNISATDVAINYIRHFNPQKDNVDYFVMSHFHGDHFGTFPENYEEYTDFPKHAEGKFYMNGLYKAGTILHFDKIIDRGYTLPINLGADDELKDYQRFLRWSLDTRGLTYEKAKPGHADQIVMRHNPSSYPDFNVRILCASGYAWTGTGTETKRTLPISNNEVKSGSPDENIFSIAFMMNFGKFNLFSAGDLQWEFEKESTAWKNADAGIIPVVNKVEVMKASHHGSTNANSAELIDKLDPQVVWVNPWRTEQPGIPCIRRFVAKNPNVNIFSTNIADGSKEPLMEAADNFKSWNGHVVIRVYPDGKYYVYVLDDNDENYTVKAIHGPYISE